ncbi:MAG: hypothetical protein UU95_C0005G0027 [Parcubacteria group bacterium GW2011_GWC2_42_12]|nr:MAG: hypothetical protein UU95_C0005G0027 [Parcubacteria group bacterium GW2011_GWC2_42_12]
MPEKYQKTIELIKKFSPKTFGIKNAYYRINKDNINLVFIVDEKNASSLISYLNSLTKIIERELGDVKIETSVYVYDKQYKNNKLENNSKLEKIQLTSNISYAGAQT